MAPTKCLTCNSSITKTNSGIACTQCKKSFHWNCGNISDKVIQDSAAGRILQWKCNQCGTRKSTQATVKQSHNDTLTETPNNLQAIQRIDSVVRDMQTYFNEKFGELQEISKILNDYGSRIKQIEEDNKILRYGNNELNVRVDNIEQAALMNSLEINGVPLGDPDNAEEIVLKIAATMVYPLSNEDWSNIYRHYRQTKQDRPPSIIVFFKDMAKRDGFLSAARAHRGISTAKIGLNGSDNLIYVNEHLTNSRKKIFYTAKNFKSNNNYKYLWTKNGKIYLRKNDDSQAINVNFYTDFTKLDGSR